jgi:CRP-like cAMP-binding protein
VTGAAAGSASEFLRRSPVFEGIPDEHLDRLAEHARTEDFAPGSDIFGDGQPADSFYLLMEGKVRLFFSVRRWHPSDEEEALHRAGAAAPFHTVSHPGHPIGWSAIVEPYAYRATARALEPTRMLLLERPFIESYARERPDFGLAFMRRILGLIGGHLRAARMGIVAHRYEDEVRAIRALLEQAASSLSVQSALHRVPHYLENRLTLADAFHALDVLQSQGDAVERELASVAAHILDGVRQELSIFQHLQRIYELVASAPHGLDPSDLRRQNAEEFRALFAETEYVARGEENLPDRSGHIFVMNHLSNHLDNMLPNDFILTLDTHFVSSMLLYERYGEAPIRVVRKSQPDEHGHQKFYDRLGYIYVYSGHVDGSSRDPNSSPEQRRRLFFDTARDHLRAGRNIVICPEGDSTETEKSPLPFKAGAFRLAAYTDPEPLIVPIAVANFDKKITRTKPVAVVHQPFKLSEVVDPADDRALAEWLKGDLQPRYRTWVREAQALGAR